MERMSNMHSKAAQDAFRGRFPQSASMRLSEIIAHACDAAWGSAGLIGNVTTTADTDSFKIGTASAMHVVDEAFTTGNIAWGVVTTANIATAGYTHVKMWVKSTVALAAGALTFGLDNGATFANSEGTDHRSVNMPAVPVADTWYRVTFALSPNQKLMKSVDSIGLTIPSNLGGFTVYVDDIRFCKYEADGSSEIVPLATYTLNNTNADGINSEMWLLPFQAGLISVFNLPQDLAIQAYQGTPGAYATTDIKSGKTPLDTGQTVIDMIRGATALVLYPGAELASGEAFEIEVA